MRTVVMVGAGASCEGPGVFHFEKAESDQAERSNSFGVEEAISFGVDGAGGFYIGNGGVRSNGDYMTRKTGNPPLGKGVLAALAEEHEDYWGESVQEYFGKFPSDFEKGMELMYRSMWVDGSEDQKNRFSYSILLMAEYFSRWNCYRDTFYARLLTQLIQNDLISTSGDNSSTTFVSLNYENLLERAIFDAGIFVLHHSRKDTRRENSVPVWKPHGSSNFVASAVTGTSRYPTEEDLDGGFHPENRDALQNYLRRMRSALEERMKEKLITGNALPPLIAMSLYMPDKPTIVGRTAIDSIRDSYRRDIEAADLLIMIGVRPVLDDHRLFDPVLIGPKRILYIGRVTQDWERREFEDFRSGCKGSVEHVANTFEEALNRGVFHA